MYAIRRILLVAMAVACVAAAHASRGREEVSRQIESTMLVTGTVEVTKEGKVGHYKLDEAEKLPTLVRDLVAKALPVFRFRPSEVNGAPAATQARMGLRVVARQAPGDRYSLRIGSASFGPLDERALAARYLARPLTPPSYPPAAYRAGVTGTVYLLVKVGARGDVEDVMTEQVNLQSLGTPRLMKIGRDLLSEACERAAREWAFKPPPNSALGLNGHVVLRVPVAFVWEGQEVVPYGQWEAYVPGPRAKLPDWVDAETAQQKPDAMIAGGLYPVGLGPQLLTALDAG